MHCAHRTLCLVGGLSLAILPGCYSYYPTRPAPTYSAPPAGVVVPQGQPGQFFQPGPTLPPQGTAAPQPQWQAPATSPDGNWDPAANPNPVPDYGDPQDLNSPPPTFGPSSQKTGTQPPSNYNAGKVELQDNVEVASATNSDFEPPMTVQPVSAEAEQPAADTTTQSADADTAVEVADADTTPAAADTDTPADPGPNPFDYDRERYTWLRGIVEFNREEKAWQIVYSANPEKQDPFGGHIALIDHPHLAGLHDHDVVLVMGQVDPKSPDSQGKPRYRVQRASKVIPRRDSPPT